MLGQVQSRHRAQTDGQRLQQDREQVRQEHDEQQLEARLRACCHVGRVVARIDVRHRNHEPRPNEAAKLA